MVTYAEMYAKGSDDGTEPPYLEGVLANKFLTTIYQSLESQGRASRYEVRKFDEIMEEFRRHVYSLRHLILSGTIEQNNDVLRRYFQVSMTHVRLDNMCSKRHLQSATVVRLIS